MEFRSTNRKYPEISGQAWKLGSFSRILLDLNETTNKPKITRTKIICTIGPKQTEESIRKLVESGMNVARLNFSFGDHESHGKVIKWIKKINRETKKLCAVMIDTQGPVIRTGSFKGGSAILKPNSFVEVFTDASLVGDCNRFSIKFKQLPKSIKVGEKITISVGIHLAVTKVRENSLVCRVVKDGVIGENKRVFIRGSSTSKLPVVTQKDVADIMFAVAKGVEYLAASSIKSPKDIENIRKILDLQGRGSRRGSEIYGNRGKRVQIFAKIETSEALTCFPDILNVADGIIIARGDLGMGIPIEEVTLVQKRITQACNQAGKPVIISTQLLTSMINNAQPTRAEATDLVNAVHDGVDCVLLSKETSTGRNPLLVLQTLTDILHEAETTINYRKNFLVLSEKITFENNQLIAEAIASAAVKTAFDTKAALILVVSARGQMARRIAKYRPNVPVFCLTSSESSAKQCMVSSGVVPILVGSMSGTDSLIGRTIKVAKKMNLCVVGDRIVVVVSAREENEVNELEDVDHVLKVLTVKY